MRWRLINMTGRSTSATKNVQGNHVLQSAPACLTWVSDDGRKMLVYESQFGMTAYLLANQAGEGGRQLTNELPQDEWLSMLGQAQAAKALTGEVPQFERDLPI